MTPTLEKVTFRLVSGTAAQDFVALARATDAAVRRQPGFQGRILTQAEDGTWTDLVLWRDPQCAQAAASAMMAEPSFAPFMAAIDMASVAMHHDAIAWQSAA